jgi:hypothetical protein
VGTPPPACCPMCATSVEWDSPALTLLGSCLHAGIRCGPAIRGVINQGELAEIAKGGGPCSWAPRVPDPVPVLPPPMVIAGAWYAVLFLSLLG